MGWLMAVAVGAVTGALSACGLGGGTLLLLYLLEVLSVEQTTAQGVNLLFFLPSALISLPAHWKGGFVEKKVLPLTILGGCFTAVLGVFLANYLETAILRKAFGVFLICIALKSWKVESAENNP